MTPASLTDFMSRVVPWPMAGEPGVVNVHWMIKDSKTGSKFWGGRPHTDVTALCNLVQWAMGRPQTIQDIYFCLSLQAKVGKFSRGKATAQRTAADALKLRAIWLDVDVKAPPKGYADLNEALQALKQFVRAANLPWPNALVASGGGLHVYWIADHDMSVDEWRPYAEGLKAAAQKHGLRADYGVTTDPARVLRIPGTFNYKTDPPQPVELLSLDPDYDFSKVLAHLSTPPLVRVTATVNGPPSFDLSAFTGKRPAEAFSELDPKGDNLTAGLERLGTTQLDPAPVLKGCPFYQDAFVTHGKDHSQPLWNLTVLGTVFMQNGRTLAHELGNGHPGYTPASTDDMYDRKEKEHEKGLGWPGCRAFENEGSTFCATCPHRGKIKSPLNLALCQGPTEQPAMEAAAFRDYDKSGNPKPSLANAVIAIRALGVEVRYDQFHNRIKVTYKGGSKTIQDGVLTDETVSAMRSLINNTYQIDCGDPNTLAALKEIARDNAYDPVLDYLAECQGKWDRQKRIDTWAIDYLGCEDTPLNRAIGRLVLVAACRRARTPGCKFDLIVVLEGVEGTNKSTAIRVLAGDENFSDQSILGAADKEVQEQLEGVWMHENADLAGMKRAEVEQIKAFASRQVDRARPAYGRVREDRPRRSIEWGTTNNDRYLLSQTGNRRFAPLKTGEIDIEALKRDRDQLLGEAATYEAAGESTTLDPSLWGDAQAAQEQRRVIDPWEDLLRSMPDHIIHRSGDGYERVASADVLTKVLEIPSGQQTSAHAQRLAGAMKHAGWDRNPTGRVTIDGKPVRGYIRPTFGQNGPTGTAGVLGPTGAHGLAGPTGSTANPEAALLANPDPTPALTRAQTDLELVRSRT